MQAPACAEESRIVQGDAYELLNQLPAESVDLIVTSPPYWGMRTYGLDHDGGLLDRWREHHDGDGPPGWEWYRANGGQLGQEPLPEWYIGHLVEAFSRARRALKPEASLWVNLGDTYFARWGSIRPLGRQGLGGPERIRRRTPSGGFRHDKQLLLLPARFAIAMQETGWVLRNDVIWAKTNVGPRPERDRLRLSHEHFFHFVQRRPGRRPSYFYDLAAAEEGGLDVIRGPVSAHGAGHSAAFPAALVRPRIESSSRPDGLVVDPFCGTGTALACAVSSGRRALGFELSVDHAVAASRTVSDAMATRAA